MDDLYISTYKYLLCRGFSPVHRGFKLIIKAVELICLNGNIPLKQIYSRLAQSSGVSATAVCKNIKNAIDYAALNCSMEDYEKYFGIFGDGTDITCGTFLYYTAEQIKYAV